MKSALNTSHPKISRVKNRWRLSPNAPRRSCAFSGPAVGRRTCCISSRGSGGRARGAPVLRAPPPLRCESRSLCSCGAWPPAGSCLAAAGSHKARCWESPRRSGLQETPPEGGADGRLSACGRLRRRCFDLLSLCPSDLGLLLLCGVHDGGAADLGQLAALAVERPAADLVADHVFDEEDAAVEAERQPVEELDVLQQVVVRVTEESREVMKKKKKCCIVHVALWPLAHDFIRNYLVNCRRKEIYHLCNEGSSSCWGHIWYLV